MVSNLQRERGLPLDFPRHKAIAIYKNRAKWFSVAIAINALLIVGYLLPIWGKILLLFGGALLFLRLRLKNENRDDFENNSYVPDRAREKLDPAPPLYSEAILPAKTETTINADTLRLSTEGLDIVDKARRKKKWTKTEEAWAALATTSQATLRRFWAGVPIQSETFKAIFNAVGIEDWEKFVEVQPSDSDNPQTDVEHITFAITGSLEDTDKPKLDAIVLLLKKLGEEKNTEILGYEILRAKLRQTELQRSILDDDDDARIVLTSKRTSITIRGIKELADFFISEDFKRQREDVLASISFRLNQFRIASVYEPNEILSEAYLRATKYLSKTNENEIESIVPWLKSVGLNIVREKQKNVERQRKSLERDKPHPSYDELQELSAEDNVLSAFQNFQSLTRLEQRIFHHRMIKDLSWAEVCMELEKEGLINKETYANRRTIYLIRRMGNRMVQKLRKDDS